MGEASSRRLRIAIVAPPFYEVPPPAYGGTERVCYLLAQGLVDRGHDVTLIAAGGHHTRARFVATFPEAQKEGADNATEVEVLHAARAAIALADLQPDVVHDHTMAGPLTAASRAAPTVSTVHAAVVGPDSHAEALLVLGRWVSLVAISEAHRRGAPHLNWVATVHNGIPVEEYPFRADKEDYVLYLGRLSPHKGVHLAIDAARAAGRRLVIAGSWTIPFEEVYFRQEIRPRLGPGVEWVGEVGTAERNRLLAGAACLLYPLRWQEPFGLAIVEAMACGTPVVGLRAGSLPELVVEGETGLLRDTPSELPEAIHLATGLDPRRCRAHAARRFDATRMVEGYEAVYRRLLAGA
jgi:glycosyltransferase involved in cell wall biosynthesis